MHNLSQDFQANDEARAGPAEVRRPIDREDLFALSRSIDDILDYAYTTIHEVEALAVTPDSYICQMVEILYTGANEIHLAVEQLEQQPRAADEHARRARSLEHHMEALYTRAVADLFDGAADLAQVMDILKLREVYRHLLHAARSVGAQARSATTRRQSRIVSSPRRDRRPTTMPPIEPVMRTGIDTSAA